MSYEDFLASDQATVVRLMEFLNCDPAMLREFGYRRHRSQSTLSAREYIRNYEQLIEAVKDG